MKYKKKLNELKEQHAGKKTFEHKNKYVEGEIEIRI